MTEQRVPGRVSVVIAAFNAESTIGAAISGVLGQTYSDVELIVVDDGSTDRTRLICEAYGDRLTLICGPNSGPAVARNRGLEVATGEYIALCDADDILLPPAMALSLALLSKSPPRSIVTNEAYLLTTNGLAHGRRLLRKTVPQSGAQVCAILERNFVGIFAVFPRRLLDEVGIFNARLRNLEDWELWMRAVLSGWRIRVQPSPVALYRLTGGSLSTDPNIANLEHQLLVSISRTEPALTRQEQLLLDRRLKSDSPVRLRQQAAEAIRNGHTARARELYSELAPLIKSNRPTYLRAQLIARVPGMTRLFAIRQQVLDRRLGHRLTASVAAPTTSKDAPHDD